MSIQFSLFYDFFPIFNIIHKTPVPITAATIHTIFLSISVDNVDKTVYKSLPLIFSYFFMWITVFSILWQYIPKMYFLYNSYKSAFVKPFLVLS